MDENVDVRRPVQAEHIDGNVYQNYDNVGNVRTITDPRAGMSQSFTYDPLDRLATSNGMNAVSAFSYDVHGNRTTNGTTYAYEPGTLRLASRDNDTFTYDANGNLKTTPTSTFNYTVENWLSSATTGSTTTSYQYDADGWRAKKVATGDTTYYLRGLNGELLTEWHSLGATARARDYIYAGTRLLSAVDRTTALPNGCGGEAIPDGSPIPITIPTGGVASATFEGSACRTISIKVVVASGSSTTFGCGWYIRVYKPNGSLLAQDSQCWTATGFLEPVMLPDSGSYSIVVDPPGSSSGAATIYVYDVVDETGPIVANGVMVSAPLLVPGERAVLSFVGIAGHRITANVAEVGNLGGCGWWVRILNPDQSVLKEVKACWNSSVFIEPLLIPADGTYSLVVDPESTFTDTATVNLYDVVDQDGPLVANGQSVTANLLTPGQRTMLAFTGIAGHRMSVNVVETAGDLGGCGWWVRLLKADLSLLTEVKTCWGTAIFVEPFLIPTNGTYYVVVDPETSFTGVAKVNLYDVVDQAEPLPVGEPALVANLLTPGQCTMLSFTGTAGHRMSVNVVQTSGDLGGCGWWVRIFKADLSPLTEVKTCWGDSIFVEPFTIPTSATYYVVVDPETSFTGTASVGLFDVVDQTGPIVAGGGAVSASLMTPGQRAVLSFGGVAGQKMSVTVAETFGNIGGCGWWARLINPDQTVLKEVKACWGSSVTLSATTLLTTGTYYVIVDPETSFTGGANVTLTEVP